MVKYPYFSPSPKYYEEFTDGMSDTMKKGLANALAHGMMPIFTNEDGVWLTRCDYILPGKYYRADKPNTSLVDTDGVWHYYKEFKGVTSS